MELHQFNPMKALVHADRMRQILGGRIPPPVVLNLDITNRCNHKCRWCYVRDYIRGNAVEMETRTAVKIMKGARECGAKSVLFTGGGEPTLHPLLPKLIMYAMDIGMQAGLSTNGTGLAELLSVVAAGAMKYIRVSLDAGCAETHARLHGCAAGEWDKILDAASDIAATRRTTLGFAFLVVPDNLAEIPQAVAIAKRVGFDYIEIRPSVQGYSMSKREHDFAVALCDLEEQSAGADFKVYPLKKRFEDLRAGGERPKCVSTPLVAVVTADAKLNLCCQYRGTQEWQWGDLKEEKFSDLWGGKAHRMLLEKAEKAVCPVCRMIPYNEIVRALYNDAMHFNFL